MARQVLLRDIGGLNQEWATLEVADIPAGGGGVTSVNGDTGPAVVLDAADVGADVAGSAAAVGVTAAALSSHEADTTLVHGITNTANLALLTTKLDAFGTPDDNSNLNSTSGHHGLLPKLTGSPDDVLLGDGTWAPVTGGGGVTSAYARRAPHYLPFTPAGGDDEFDDGAFSGWTAIEDAAPVLTLTESFDNLTIFHPGGDAAAELHGWAKAWGTVTNDWVEMCFVGIGPGQNFNACGLFFSDGTTWGTSDLVTWYFDPQQNRWTIGNFTNFNTVGTLTNHTVQVNAAYPNTLMRLRYEGSNNWRGYVSTNGVVWLDVTGAVSRTLTPTHAGFMVTSWGGALDFTWTIRYVRFGNG